MPNRLEEARARREASKQRLMQMFAARQRIAERQSAEAEAAQKAAEEKAAYEEGTAWGAPALQGAAMGGQVAGPWGALAGGILGSAYGQTKGYQARKDAGQSTGKALWDSYLNPIETTKGFFEGAKRSPGAAAAAGGSIGEGYRKHQEGITAEKKPPATGAAGIADMQAAYGAGGSQPRTLDEAASGDDEFRFKLREPEDALAPPKKKLGLNYR